MCECVNVDVSFGHKGTEAVVRRRHGRAGVVVENQVTATCRSAGPSPRRT